MRVQARRDVPEHEIGVTGQGLRVARHREVGTEGERLLDEARGGGVVDRDERRCLMRLPAERRDVDDLEGRVARRLQPQEARADELLGEGARRGRVPAHLHATHGEVVEREPARSVVAVGRHDEHVARPPRALEDGRHRRHARREDDRRSALQLR